MKSEFYEKIDFWLMWMMMC